MEQTVGIAGLDARTLKHIRSTAKRAARTGALPGMDAADIEQELVLDLWRRREAYDPSRASFRTLADRVVANRLASLTSPTARLVAERSLVRLDAPLDASDDVTLADGLADPTSETGIDERHGLTLDVRRFVAGLTPALRRCCSILLAPNVRDAAALAGLHRSSVYEGAQRLRHRAIAAGLRDYLGAPRHTARRAGR